MKNNKKKGFTLMELLIVIAIIVILVAIAIPVFGGQLTKAKETTDIANIRSAYASAQTAYASGEVTKVSDAAAYMAKDKIDLQLADNYTAPSSSNSYKASYNASKVTGTHEWDLSKLPS